MCNLSLWITIFGLIVTAFAAVDPEGQPKEPAANLCSGKGTSKGQWGDGN